MTKSTPFGNMLTEAIYNIRLREHKLISTVQNEVGSAIGRNGSTIEYWRKGNIPAKEADLIRLTRSSENVSRLRKLGLSSFWRMPTT